MIIESESIILKNNLSDIFENMIPNMDLINSLNIKTIEKDILIAFVNIAKQQLAMIGNGLKFIDLVKARLHHNELINDTENILHQLDERHKYITYLISIAEKINQIDEKRQDIIHTFQALECYLQEWSLFIEACLDKKIFNMNEVIQSCQLLMSLFIEIEYQYNRELVD